MHIHMPEMIWNQSTRRISNRQRKANIYAYGAKQRGSHICVHIRSENWEDIYLHIWIENRELSTRICIYELSWRHMCINKNWIDIAQTMYGMHTAACMIIYICMYSPSEHCINTNDWCQELCIWNLKWGEAKVEAVMLMEAKVNTWIKIWTWVNWDENQKHQSKQWNMYELERELR